MQEVDVDHTKHLTGVSNATRMVSPKTEISDVSYLVVYSFYKSAGSAIRTCDENGFPKKFVRHARGTMEQTQRLPKISRLYKTDHAVL